MFNFYKKDKTKGFTLIELLVVIAIIGVLSSIVLASLNEARSKARDARRISDLENIRLALELYRDDNGGYPVFEPGANMVNAARSNIPNGTNGWNALDAMLTNISLPRDPLNQPPSGFFNNPIGGNYVYIYASNGNNYDLFARLENAHQVSCPNSAITAKFVSFFGTTPGNSLCG